MSVYQRQKAEKPGIEDTMARLLAGAKLDGARAFVGFLRESGVSLSWGAVNSYNASYKGRRVCILKFAEDFFEIRSNTQYDEAMNARFAGADETTRAFLLGSVTYCSGCGTCKPGLSMTLLGRPVENACYNPVINLTNPDDGMLALARELALMRKEAIADGRAPRVTYIAKSKRKD